MNVYIPKREFKIISINTAFERYADGNFYFDGEMHDFWEMVYVAKGSMIVSEDSRVYELTEGQIVFHKPMEFHRLRSKSDGPSTLIIISFKSEGNEIDMLGDGVFELDINLREQLFDVFSQIINSFDCNIIVYPKSIDRRTIDENMAFLKLELFLLTVACGASPGKQQKYTASAHNYKKIIQTMNSHIYENLSVDDIARLCCLSTSNLKKTFKMYAGCGVMRHFNRIKIIRAMALIREGYSICEISDRLSFSSPNYFSAVFKRETGMLPTDYRNKKGDSEGSLINI